MDNLQHAYSNLLTQGGQLLSNIGKGVSSAVGNVGNYISQDIQRAPQVQAFNNIRQFTATPQFQQGYQNVKTAIQNSPVTRYIGSQPLLQTPGIGNITPFKVPGPTVGQYVGGQIVKPLEQGLSNIFQAKNIPQAIQGGLQSAGGAFGATPEGFLFNTSRGAIAGGINATKGQPLNQALTQGMTENPSIGSAILPKNPFLAMGIDLLSGNPKGTVESLVKGGNLLKAAKSVEGDSQILSNAAAKEIAPIIAKVDKNAYVSPQEFDTLQNTAKAVLNPKTKADIKAFNQLGAADLVREIKGAYTQDQQFAYRQVPGYQVPGMGLISKDRNPLGANQPAGGSEPLPWENAQGQTLPEFASKEQNAGVKIPTDKATQQTAETRAVLESLGKVDSGTKQTFADWVNQRKATKVEGLLKQREFSDLNNKGLDGIFEFQSGNKTGRFGDVQKYFDQKYNEVKKAGIELNYKKDYLPQLWNNSQQEVEQVFGRSLGTKPSFSMDSIIKNYEEGIKAGLTPRFNTIGDLAGWYEQRANKAIADMNFFTKLGKDGFIQPGGKAPRDWVSLNPDTFPKVKTNIDGQTYNGVYKAPRELADMINNYLYSPANGNTFSRALNGIANFVSRAKNITLSFGVPGTGINAHGFNILARHTLGGTGGNPITRLLTGAKYMLHPGSAVAELDKTLATAPEAVKNGLTLSAEEHTALLNQSETFAKSFGKNWNNLFEKPLFNKMIPALKLDSYNQLVKNGTDAKAAAKLVNNVYGGMNWEQMGRSRDYQNFLRTIILAPDWAESTVRLGGNLGKSFIPTLKNGSVGFLGGETGARYRTMATTILGSYVALNIANKLTSGHYAFQNDPGHTFELQVGYTQDGQKRYLKPYGTSVDFLRLPFDTAIGLAQGDPSPAFRAIANRLSIPLGSAMHLLTNVDYKGQPIYGRDKYGNDIPPIQAAGGIGSEVLGSIGFPSFAKNTIDTATGKQGIEQGATQALELPFRYQSPGNSKTQQFVAQVSGAQGKQLYDLKKSVSGQSPFSANQQNAIKQGGMSVMNQILTNRANNKLVTDAQNKAKANQQGGAVGNTIITNSGKSINLTPPTKGQGIDAYTNQNWKYTKAYEVQAAKDQLTSQQYTDALNQLGVTPQQAEYGYKASRSTDIKTQYIMGKAQTMDHATLLNELVKGRQESITGTQFVSDTVVKNLNDQGIISNSEAQGLKNTKFDQNGNQIAKVSSGKKVSVKVPKIPKLKLVTPKAVKVKASRAGSYTLKAPKLKIAPIPRFGSSLPKAKKVRLSA